VVDENGVSCLVIFWALDHLGSCVYCVGAGVTFAVSNFIFKRGGGVLLLRMMVAEMTVYTCSERSPSVLQLRVGCGDGGIFVSTRLRNVFCLIGRCETCQHGNMEI
jgi:hypothetical protein